MFSRQRSSSSSAPDQEIRKFPYRRLQQTVDRFIKVLEIDVDRLTQHKYNIDKYTRYGDHRLLNREHINASRTVEQLKANLVELDRTRLQVEDCDVKEFDKRTTRIRHDAATVLAEFIEECSREASKMKRSPSEPQSLPPSLRPSHDFEELPPSEDVAQMQRSADLESDYAAMLEAELSWRRLQDDLQDLNELMKELSKAVHEQQEMVDTIEDNIDDSLADVQKGNNYLAKAARYKAALYPLAGGLMGCAVGGPVGFVMGMKAGMAAAVGGSIVGVTGGRLLKGYNDRRPPMIELKEHKASSTSCPSDLHKL